MPAVLLNNLVITDGTDSFRFIDARMLLQSWRPAVGSLRGGGVWRTPLFDSGSSLVMGEYDDITDVFELCSPATTEDGTYARLMDLFELLEKARHYWISSYATEPVWIEAQGPQETNRRYAVIKDWRMPNLGRGPFDQEFTECINLPSQTVQLTLVHSLWQSTEPLSPECVTISAEQEFTQLTSAQVFRPTQSTDDAYTDDATGLCDVASAFAYVGNLITDIVETGVRFRTVTIPQGSTITSAFIRFTCNNNTANVTCNAQIKGQRASAPAVFVAGAAGYTDFKGRPRTNAKVNWRSIGAWVAGTTYDSPDISPIIEEIVGLGSWASGNDLVVFIDDNPWDPSSNNAYRSIRTWDHVTANSEPELWVTYGQGTSYGRSAACLTTGEDVGYVVNKHAKAQLTNVYHYDASTVTWSANLMGAALPFAILPNPIQNGDIIFFGIDGANNLAGPFSNLVFDIQSGTEAVYSDLGGACNITWQYWNGAAWVALTVCDNTSYTIAAPGFEHLQDHPWRRPLVESVHWEQPAAWAQTAVTHPVDGAITGWWVRAYVNLGGGESIAPVPTQQNRTIYTCCWPYVEVDDDEVTGDVGALLRLDQYGKSDFPHPPVPVTWEIDKYIQRILIAARSSERDYDDRFTPYLNAGASAQFGSIYGRDIGTNTAYVADPTAPTGSIDQVTYVGATAALAMESGWRLYFPEAWFGRFRVFLRYVRTAGADSDISVQLRVKTLNAEQTLTGSLWISEEHDLVVQANEYLMHDFGLVVIPPGGDSGRAGGSVTQVTYILIEVWLQNTVAAARTINIIDLILMPADEFLIEMRAPLPQLIALTESQALEYTQVLLTDGTVPNVTMAADVHAGAFPNFVTSWIAHNTGRPQLRPRKGQRLWWLMARADVAGPALIPYRWRPEHEMSMGVIGKKSQRYLAVRGSR